MRVLVVTNEPLVAWSLRDELENVGHVVVGNARSSGEALLLCKTISPDCVIVNSHLERAGVSMQLAQHLSERHNLSVVLSSPVSDVPELESTRTLKVIPKTSDARAIVDALPPKQATTSER